MEAAAEASPEEQSVLESPVKSTDTPPKCQTEAEVVQEIAPTAPLPLPQQAQEVAKKSKREERTKKDDRNVDQFLKSLNSIPNIDDKLTLVIEKYQQVAESNKNLQFYNKQSDKRYALLGKEKEHLQLEYNKIILFKSKLESLCRELQKQNKAIKEESLLRIREEEERRKETQAKFQTTLSEITTLLQQNSDKNAKLREDNISMTEKFKSIMQQYQIRDQQVEKLGKQMSLESQLSEAKLQKAKLEHQADRERLLAEIENFKVTVAQYQARILELQNTEAALKEQLIVYTDKYEDFQRTFVKSNEVFGGFKVQMEDMSLKVKKLEKESISWRQRWQSTQTSLLDMCGERQLSEERTGAALRQLHQMQDLCRALQAERGFLVNVLKEHNIERPPFKYTKPPPGRSTTSSAPPAGPTATTSPLVPTTATATAGSAPTTAAAPSTAPATTTVPAPSVPASVSAPTEAASPNKVNPTVADCSQIRQTLAHFKSEFNFYNEEPSKTDKPTKTKAKKNKAGKKAHKNPVKKGVGTDKSNAAKENTSVIETEVQQLVSDDASNPSGMTLELSDEKLDESGMERLLEAMNLTDLSDLAIITEEDVETIDIENGVNGVNTDCADALPIVETSDKIEIKPDDTVSNVLETYSDEKESHVNGPKDISD